MQAEKISVLLRSQVLLLVHSSLRKCVARKTRSVLQILKEHSNRRALEIADLAFKNILHLRILTRFVFFFLVM